MHLGTWENLAKKKKGQRSRRVVSQPPSLSDFIRQGWRNADPSDYVHGWHIDAICDHLQAVTQGHIRRLIINIPPRHMKSLAVSVFWPAWSWIDKPELRFLFASYAQSLSMRDSVKCRRIIESPWYQQRWGDRFQLTGDQNTKSRFDTTKNGYRLATSVDGSLTGEGGDIIVVDDPHNVRESESEATRGAVLSWWDEAMSTRLNDPKTGAYVIVMQRVHEKDLVGHILAREHDWEHLCLPARYETNHPRLTPVEVALKAHPEITLRGDPRTRDGELLWPERFGETEMRRMELTLGTYGSAGQLQQRPAPRGGGMFKREWFEFVDAVPIEAQRVRYWDKAGTEDGGDYTVGTLVARDFNGITYIEDVVRGQWSAHNRNIIIRQTAEADRLKYPTSPPTILLEQEGGSGGKESAEISIRELAGYAVYAEHPTGSKEVRAEPFAAQCEAGNVKIKRAPWNEEFLRELEVFPNGTHDDQVDTSAGGFNKLALSGSTSNVFSLN